MERENCNRLAEFRQLRKDIRGSDEHLIGVVGGRITRDMLEVHTPR